MKSPVTKQGPAQHLDHSPPSELYSLICLLPSLFSPITSVCQSAESIIIDYAWRLNSWLSSLPGLCPQKLPPNHLFGLHFLHCTNDWKLLSLLFIFYWVSLNVFVPPQSPDWVYLPGCLPALVILCWKANLKASNVLPFFYCCFCKESSNKQIHPPPPNIWCLSGALNSWSEWVCGKKDRMVIQLTCKN